MSSSIIVASILASLSVGSAQSLDPLAAPKGEYVVSTRPCADLQTGVGALELMEFDGSSISMGASICKIAGVRQSGGVFQASCSERGASPKTTVLRISRPSERSLSIDGSVYNLCEGR